MYMTTYRKAYTHYESTELNNFRYCVHYEICMSYFWVTVSATVDWSVGHICELRLNSVS